MKYPFDIYEACIKRQSGDLKLNVPFQKISEWITEKFEVQPLYVGLTSMPASAMLHIVFSDYDDLLKFKTGSETLFGTFPSSEKAYRQILKNYGIELHEYLHLDITHFSLLCVMIIYSKSDLMHFAQILKEDALWKIHNVSAYKTAFFFNTERDKEVFDTEASINFLRAEFYKYLKKYDEYDCLEKDRMHIIIDSKDNFVNNYQSSKQYYFRDH